MIARLHRPEGAFVGLYGEPVIEFGTRPFDALVGAKRVGLGAELEFGGSDRLVKDAEDP